MGKAATFAFTLFFAVFAQVPRTMDYRGYLTDAGGNPLDGTYSITFRIYDAATGGNLLWYETKSVTIANGYFDVQLDLSTNGGDTLKFDRPYWLALKVGSDAEMSPREKLAPVSFAFRSIYSDTAKYAKAAAGGAPSGYKVCATLSSSTFYGDHNCDDNPSTCCPEGYHMCSHRELAIAFLYGCVDTTVWDNFFVSEWGWVDNDVDDCEDWTCGFCDGFIARLRIRFDSTSGTLYGIQDSLDALCNHKQKVWCCKEP